MNCTWSSEYGIRNIWMNDIYSTNLLNLYWPYTGYFKVSLFQEIFTTIPYESYFRSLWVMIDCAVLYHSYDLLGGLEKDN